MKKLFLIIPVLAMSFASCGDLMNEDLYTSVGKDNFVNNATEAEVVLRGCYADLCQDGTYAYHLSLLFTLSTDIAQCEGSTNNSFREIPTNSHNASTSQIFTTWTLLYSAIYNVNDFIETVSARMDKWSDSDRALAAVQIAEARTLRALYYFELVRWFGNVALITTTAESRQDASKFKQAAPAEIYRFIEQDLKAAAEVLPWASDDAVRSSNAFRMSRGSALGLLTKVYVTWAGYPVKDETKWADAVLTGRRIVNSGKHTLLTDYADLWRNTCNGRWDSSESLIEVSFYSPTGLESSDPTGRIGKWNGVLTDARSNRGRNAGNWKVVGTFSEAWEATGDPRYKLSVADYVYGYTKVDKNINIPGYLSYEDMIKLESTGTTTEDKLIETRKKKRQIFTPAKWDTEKYVEQANALFNNDRSNVNWYVLRYSDVLLLYAEALTESGGSMTEAANAVNTVRRRGFGDAKHDLATTLTREELRDAIRQERAYELCFEGHRRQDLIRWGVYYETIRSTSLELANWLVGANYAVAQYTQKNKHELFPIPQRDYDMLQATFKQNPGWGK